MDKGDLDNLVIVTDERIEDAADVRRVELRVADRAERAARSSIALIYQAFAVCRRSQLGMI